MLFSVHVEVNQRKKGDVMQVLFECFGVFLPPAKYKSSYLLLMNDRGHAIIWNFYGGLWSLSIGSWGSVSPFFSVATESHPSTQPDNSLPLTMFSPCKGEHKVRMWSKGMIDFEGDRGFLRVTIIGYHRARGCSLAVHICK